MTSAVKRVLYLSRSNIGFEDGDFENAIRNILGACARNNAPAKITGALLYDRGRFVQWLEGPAREVDQLYAVVTRDDRHCDVTTLISETSDRRRFAEWRMAFTKVGETAIYRLPSFPLADQSPPELADYLETSLKNASGLSVAV